MNPMGKVDKIVCGSLFCSHAKSRALVADFAIMESPIVWLTKANCASPWFSPEKSHGEQHDWPAGFWKKNPT